MGFRLPLLLSSLLAACGSSRVEHVAALEFGDVAVGQSRRVALELKNQGTVAVALTFEATGDFTIDEASRTLAPNEDAILLVRFSPTDVGARSGTLAMHSASGTAPLSLSGRGTFGSLAPA